VTRLVLRSVEYLPVYLVRRSQIENFMVTFSANPFGDFFMAGSIDAARIFCPIKAREGLQNKEEHTPWKLAFPVNNQVRYATDAAAW
jgi:hypothetical protein